MIRSTYDPVDRTSEVQVLRPVIDADLLVLDDLGAEKTSDWVEETLNLIVNERYNQRRATIFTSNYEEKEDRDDPESLLARVGFRMHSRLYEMCEFLEFDGADFRHAEPNSGPNELLALWKTLKRPGKLPSRSGGPAPRPAPRATREARRQGRSQMERRQGGALTGQDDGRRTKGREDAGRRTKVPSGSTSTFRSARHICNYCNFNRGLFDEAAEARSTSTRSCRRFARAGDGAAADTIFFGGGTPSLLEPDDVAPS